jgi:hypothetical protein
VLTNDTVADSLDYLNRTLGYGGEPVTPVGPGSLPRFARAANGAYAARANAGKQPVDDAFAILADVSQADSTQWSIVYELRDGRVHFTTSSNPERRRVELAGLDLDCTADVLVADLATDGGGAAALVPYSEDTNRKIIEAGFSAARLTAPSSDVIDTMAAYPDGLLCTFEAAGD